MKTAVLTVCYVALLLVIECDTYAWDVEHDEDADDVDEVEGEEDKDEVDFVSNSNLDFVKRKEIVEVHCDGLECAAEAADASEGVPSVWARGLVTSKLKVKLILQEHARAASNLQKHFRGETLGYVTPWNRRGYDAAKRFRTKFTYISPVRLQVREDSDHVPTITGTHDIDQQWVQDVNNGAGRDEREGGGPAVAPRVVYERNISAWKIFR